MSVNLNRKRLVISIFLVVMLQFFISFPQDVFPGEDSNESVELNGDVVEYSVDGNKITITGNVIVTYHDTALSCEELEFFRDTKIALAKGNVRLVSKHGQISGENLTFNFETMTGDLSEVKIASAPFYGEGKGVGKIDENMIIMRDAYITTSDYDKPGYRLASRRIEIYPEDKIVARNVRMMLGKVPIMYIFRYTQNLKDSEPNFVFSPGYDNKWGVFLLTKWRYHFNDSFKGAIHLDAREKKDIAWGVDLDYKTPATGNGLIRTYYMNERSITSDRFYHKRPTPTIERERFKIQWRHKWDIDEKTHAIMQYYKLSDSTILKDYFENEYEKDSSPDTFCLITRSLPKGILSFRTDVRANRFVSQVERLPEVRYNLANQELWETGLYFKNTSTYSNLTNKTASPSEIRQKTMRLDVNNELSYPMKVGIIEFKPFVGEQHTYYSKTKDPSKYNSIRGIFRTGASLSTKFYRIFDVESKMFGLNIHRLRHIITPTISYDYASNPTIDFSDLDYFDSIDTLINNHTINFSLENKLQTKRAGNTVELLRAVVGTDFRLKEHPSGGGFDQITADIDFKPTDWLTLYFDSKYDTRKDHLSSANFDIYINGGERWSLGLSKRWDRDIDDQITAELACRINPKWSFKFYDRFDLGEGVQKEQQFTVTRDLHSWEMDINFNHTRGEGDELLLLFRLKAFPDIGIDMGTSFNKREAGTQN